MSLSRLIPFLYIALTSLIPANASALDIFANINLERKVMVSRDAMTEFISNHREYDPDFQYVRKIRYFSGNTVGIDVTSDFLKLSTKRQYVITNKILESWRVSKPDHIPSAAVKMYVQRQSLPFIYVSYSNISEPDNE